MQRRLRPVLSHVAHQVRSHWMGTRSPLCPGSFSVDMREYTDLTCDLPHGVTWEAQINLPARRSSCFLEALRRRWKSRIMASTSCSLSGFRDNSPATLSMFTPRKVTDWLGSWIFAQFIWNPRDRRRIMRASSAALQLWKSEPLTIKSSR